jgi:hypothetical protein
MSKPSDLGPGFKNKDNRNVPLGTFFGRSARRREEKEGTHLAIKLKRTDTTLDLSQKAFECG